MLPELWELLVMMLLFSGGMGGGGRRVKGVRVFFPLPFECCFCLVGYLPLLRSRYASC